MNYIKRIVAVGAFSMLALVLPAAVSAQWGGYGNGPYGNGNGRYGNGNYGGNIRGTLENLKNRAKDFESATNRASDRGDDRWGNNRNGGWGNRGGYGNYGGYGNNGSVDRIEDLADSFKKATDKLLDSYGRGRDLSGSENEARRVMDIANQIDGQIYNLRDRNLQNQWNQIRYDLNVVANTYGYGGYNNNNGNGNRNRNGNWRSRIPFPLPF